MPLTSKGEEIKSNMEKEYGPKKGDQVLYASKNAGSISGIDAGMDLGDQTATGGGFAFPRAQLQKSEPKIREPLTSVTGADADAAPMPIGETRDIEPAYPIDPVKQLARSWGTSDNTEIDTPVQSGQLNWASGNYEFLPEQPTEAIRETSALDRWIE